MNRCPTCGASRDVGCTVECQEAMPPRDAKAYRAWADARQREITAPRDVVQLSDLSPEMRRAVLALIDAQAAACANGHHEIVAGRCKYASAHRPEPPRRPQAVGAAPSKEESK